MPPGADIPELPRPVDTARPGALGRDGRALPAVRAAHHRRAGLVHRSVSLSSSSSTADAPKVAYTLGIYLLNIFLAFITPKFDPSLEQDEGMEDGTAGGLPTKQDDEFRPFVRRLPEFKFWHSATRAIVIGFTCSFFRAFDLPVFWPILVMYWFLLFVLTSELCGFEYGRD
jgi:hypothetical protein